MREVRSTPFVLAASLLAWAALAGCGGGPMRFVSQGTSVAPDANALIMADIDRRESITELNLKVDGLPPPERLGGTRFVAWAKPERDNEWRRVGALSYDPVMHRGELFGGLVARTSFDLVISAEVDGYTEAPSSVVIISQDISD